MPTFLEEYFPNAYKNMISNSLTPDSLRCVLFGDFAVNLYRSSLYLITFISSYTITMSRIHIYTKMRIGGWLVLLAAVIGIIGLKLWLIISSRILFGIGIGIIIHVVATHASEMAPCTYRRQVMKFFPQAISSGILMANLLFYALRTPHIGSGVALMSLFSLTFVAIFVGAKMLYTSDLLECLLDDSLEITEYLEETLGPTNYEFDRYLIQKVQAPPSSTIFERKYMLPLIMVVCISIFQQFTGVYAFMIYAPVLFKTIGLGQNISLLCSSVMYGVNLAVTSLSSATIDKFARRSSFLLGGITMLLCQIIIAYIILVRENLGVMPKGNAILLVVAMSAYVAGFAWSWGPLGWLVPCEILPLKIQPIGSSLCVTMNMISMFFVTQFFTMGLCGMKFGMHLIILGSVLLMTIFVYVLLPEAKDVIVDENVSEIWTRHWFWKKFIKEY